MTKILFMGTPDFGAEVLAGLVENSYNVIGVVTQPDRPKGRKKTLTAPPVKLKALEFDIPVYQPEKISDPKLNQEIIDLEADLIITAAYGQFLPKSILDSAKIAAINVHASLLPKYRGGAPIHHAIYHGEEETGISIIYMVEKMDAGDIISQKSIPIESSDNVGIMFEKLAKLGRQTLLEVLPDLIEGRVEPIPQDESKVTYSPNITKEQEQIDWTRTSEQIDCHVRALDPFPSSYTWLDGERVKIWKGRPTTVPSQESGQKPGQIVEIDSESLTVLCGQGTHYKILEWQESGKRRMKISDYLNGVKPNEIIGKAFQVK